eukprot:2415667-Amphidinium_carterae.1
MMCHVIPTYLIGQGYDLVVRSPNISSSCQDDMSAHDRLGRSQPDKASWEEKKHPNKPHTKVFTQKPEIPRWSTTD